MNINVKKAYPELDGLSVLQMCADFFVFSVKNWQHLPIFMKNRKKLDFWRGAENFFEFSADLNVNQIPMSCHLTPMSCH